MTTRRVVLASLVFVVLLASFSVLPGQPFPRASAGQPSATQEPRQFGGIVISTSPHGYPLSIDGQPRGNTSTTERLFDLEPGAHNIEVVFPGGDRWSHRLSIRGGQRICISLSYKAKSPGEASPEGIRLPPSTKVYELRHGYVTATILDCGAVAAEPPIAKKKPDIILRSPQPSPAPQPTPAPSADPPIIMATPEPPPADTEPDMEVTSPPPPASRSRVPRTDSSPSPVPPRSTQLPPPPPPPPPPPAETTPAEPQKPEDKPYQIVPIFYGTDRARTGAKEPRDFYGAERGQLELGRCEISIPKTHVRGNLESPSIWRGEFKEDPEKHVVLLKLTPLGTSEFNSQFQARLGEVKSRDVFVFIHGYNVKFVDAARRTAQLSYDLGFPGVPVLYSWPSQGTLWGYFTDEKAIEATEPHLKQFLSGLVAQANGARIHLVAHSMGNRALTGVLKSFAAENAGTIFNEVILTAPDVDAETLRDLAPHLKKVARHITLYASSSDAALLASKEAHGGKKHRAGDTLPEIIVVPEIDSVDASGINTDMLGHSYFAEMKPVMDDIGLLLIAGKLPSERSLLEQVREAGKYWSLPGVVVGQNGARPGALWWARYLTVTNIVIFAVLFIAFVAITVWLVLRARRRRAAAATVAA